MAKKTSKRRTKDSAADADTKPAAKGASTPASKTAKKATTRTHAGASRPASKPASKKASKKTTKKAGKKTGSKPAASAAGKSGARPAGVKGIPKPKAGKMVYHFSPSKTEGGAVMRDLLGTKGANLAEMTTLGLPVPPGFTITTETCAKYHDGGKRLPHGLMNEVHKHVSLIEKDRGAVFGSTENPMLLSVRSGAPVPMPGMLDTILNLGLNDEAVEGLAKASGNERFAFDAYRRLINMFGDVVMGIAHDKFERAFDQVKAKHGAKADTDLDAQGLRELCAVYMEVYRKSIGDEFPQNPFKQLELAIEAVFRCWHADRAVAYRRIAGIPDSGGTAVNIQAMVFGNMGEDSGTGVAFTRSPSTGENTLYGEFLINAQGEDVVSGLRSPRAIGELATWNKSIAKQLQDVKKVLETHTTEMQDLEFTVERGELSILQTRTGKRTGAAAVVIACDLVKEGLIDEREALLRVPAGDLDQLLLPVFDTKAKAKATLVTHGLPASPGAAIGHPAFSPEEAIERAALGERVILVRDATSPGDVDGMHAAAGILTSTGGVTSHAAVVARDWGLCCVVGAEAIHIDHDAGVLHVDGREYGRGDLLSIDGSTGEIFTGAVGTSEPPLSPEFTKLMRWADKYRTLGIRADVDTPAEALVAKAFGAEGVGLSRTERCFLDDDRLPAMWSMVLAPTKEHRDRATEKLLPELRDDFLTLFRAMKGMPVAIRLLDAPLHEFLPTDDDVIMELVARLRIPEDELRDRIDTIRGTNPALGHRACRLVVSHPEILRLQVRALAEATIDATKENVRVVCETILPRVSSAREIEAMRALIDEEINVVREQMEWKRRVDLKIGAMIDVPRAALTADELAPGLDFLCFGTDELTTQVYGFAREEVAGFLAAYLDHDLFASDPFESLDLAGVGRLIETGAKAGRGANELLRVGMSGEHGGDADSVHFAHRAGLDYVSCPPHRVPIARLAAAQAAIMHG